MTTKKKGAVMVGWEMMINNEIDNIEGSIETHQVFIAELREYRDRLERARDEIKDVMENWTECV